MSDIEEYYNNRYDEWGRLERHRIEFEITKRVLNEYIEPGSKVLDAGGGPGRYSIYLAQHGHRVTLFDLSETLVRQAAENAANAGVILQRIIKGNVLELEKAIPDKTFDVVLCMGPLYHLLEESERQEAIKQCLARLKPGGVLIAAFISAYAPIISCIRKNPQDIKAQKDRFNNLLKEGRSLGELGFTDAYFINPEKIETQFSGFPLETIRIIAVESLAFMREYSLMQLPEDCFQEWMDFLYKISDNKALLGSSIHLLYIGRKV